MINFDYDDNGGSTDKILRLSCEVPCFSWVIWGEVEIFSKISTFLREGGDYLVAGESSGGSIYWSMRDGELWILHADLESWDFGLRLANEERLTLMATIDAGSQP